MTTLLTSGAIAYADAQKVDSLFQKTKDSATSENAITLLSKKVPRLIINRTKSEPGNTYTIKMGHQIEKTAKTIL
ncbi:hypothetical protein [Chryseobacterium sp.]|uniref:hypothetical protein n=1 Tax=Chryseobacterium sp. TaxID=1871047 RepID=UPI0025C0BFD3|nr:hypothetical protein [Chryseobacterium sp.]